MAAEFDQGCGTGRARHDAIPAISASAARGKEGKLYLALVNTDPKVALDVAVEVAGAKAQSASRSVLTAQAMDAHNSFEEPKAVVPAPSGCRPSL